MKLELMRCVLHRNRPRSSIDLDLWDEKTVTGVELHLTFPDSVIDATYNYFDYLRRTGAKVEPVRIMIFHSLINKEGNSFPEALVKVGGVD